MAKAKKLHPKHHIMIKLTGVMLIIVGLVISFPQLIALFKFVVGILMIAIGSALLLSKKPRFLFFGLAKRK